MKPLLASLQLLLSFLGSGAVHAADPPQPTYVESPLEPPAMKLPLSTFPAPAPSQHPDTYAAAVKAEIEAQMLVDARTKALGAEDKETLHARLLMLEAIMAQDKDDDAEPLLKQLLPVVTRVYGAEARETLRCQSDLSAALAGQSRFAEAAALCRSLIPLATRVLGAENVETLQTRRRFAGALFELGKLGEAEQEYHALALTLRSKLGAENAETLEAGLLQAQCMHAQDRNAEAETRLRELLPVMTRALGAEHRNTLACQSLLLAVTVAQGRNAEAEAQYRRLIPTETRVLGPADGTALKTRWRFAGVLLELGKVGEAEDELRHALHASLSTLNAADASTLSTRSMEATSYRIKQKYNESAGMWRALIPYLTRLLGTEHPETLRARANLAEDLVALGQKAEAKKELRAVLAVQERVLGALSPDTLDTCGSLAQCLKEQQKFKEALPYAQRALAGCLKVHGKERANTLAAQLLVDMLTHPDSPAPAPDTAAAAPKPAPRDHPVVTVDGTPIMASDLHEQIKSQEEHLRYQYWSEPKRLEKEIASMKHTVLDALINDQLLVDEFKRIGGVIKPEFVEEDEHFVIKDTFKGDRAAFLASLAAQGVSLEKFHTGRERMMKILAMRSRIAHSIEFKDGELEEYYDTHKLERWRGPEEVKLHTLTILKTTHKTDAETRSHVESLRTQIVEGADFAQIARKESKDSHADDGGAWDWTQVSNLSEDVRNAVAKTKKGTVGEIIEETGLFILLRVEDRRAPAPPSYEKVKKDVARDLEKELREKRIEIKLKALREAADIQEMGPV